MNEKIIIFTAIALVFVFCLRFFLKMYKDDLERKKTKEIYKMLVSNESIVSDFPDKFCHSIVYLDDFVIKSSTDEFPVSLANSISQIFKDDTGYRVLITGQGYSMLIEVKSIEMNKLITEERNQSSSSSLPIQFYETLTKEQIVK